MSWISTAIKGLGKMPSGADLIGNFMASGAKRSGIKIPGVPMGGAKMPSISDTAAEQISGAIAGSTPVPILQDLVNREYTPEMYAAQQDFNPVLYSGLQEYNPSEMYRSAGSLDPALVQQSGMLGIKTDPKTVEAQMRALQGLTDVSQQGGMTAIDKSRLAQIQASQQQIDRGQRDAILQQQAMRGQGGNTLAALLQGQQGSSNAANMQALDVNAQAQQRALEAMIGAGQLGGQINQQQFGQQAQQQQAQDAINRFNNQNMNQAQQYNLSNRQDISNENVSNLNRAQQGNIDLRNRVNMANVDLRNSASSDNIANRNRIAEANTDLRNQAMGQNVDLRNQANQYNVVTRPQTIFGMQSGNNQAIAAGISNAGQMSNANRWRQQAINQQDRGAAIGAAGTLAGGAAAGGFFSKTPKAAGSNLGARRMYQDDNITGLA